ncbi:MAG: hypothetical protein WA517_11210 [Candidatus Acidiferrum sp.]
MKRELRRLTRKNLMLAEERWSGEVNKRHLQGLRSLTEGYRFAIELGDLLFLDGNWYVTHAGLLRLAIRRHCAGVNVQEVRRHCDPAAGQWVFKATVYKNPSSKGFVGYGDADPSNTSPLVRGAEMRVAETRAVNRALRKAYGIGLCSAEERGWLTGSSGPAKEQAQSVKPPHHNGSNNGQPRLRDQLCLLIRQYNLDPNLVKAYAADFCGTEKLNSASRDRVESFISQLAKSAKENRDSLICKLNSYARTQEVTS